MNDLVLFGKAISDATRVRVLSALRVGELCVCELADAMELNQSTLSNHLQVIRQAGLVQTRQAGKWVYYALEPEQAGVLEAVFAHYQPVADQRLQRDATRLKKRLALRQDGCCVVGFVSEEVPSEARKEVQKTSHQKSKSARKSADKNNGKSTQKASRR